MASFKVLDDADASRVKELVYELHHYWRAVGVRLPFFTLGAASYIDAARNEDEYHDLAARLNPILTSHFCDLYERVLASLRASLGQPVAFLERFAVPGFHIYQYHPELALLRPQVHKDLQHRMLDWSPVGTPDFDHPLSFTLSIALPCAGAGLNVWPSTFRPASENGGISSPEASSSAARPTHHVYRVGELVMHSGLRYHQIAPMVEVRPGEDRLTLQGHGLWLGKEWRVYW